MPLARLACGLLLAVLVAPAGIEAQVSGAVPRPSPQATPRPAPRKPSAPKPRPAAPPAALGLQVEQDGVVAPVEDGAVYLRRGPFTLLVESPQAEHVYLSASLDPQVYDAARQGASLEAAFRTEFLLAESSGNAAQVLVVRPQALHNFRVVDPRTLFFDSWLKAGPGFRARRTAAKYLFESGEEVPIEASPARPLYLVLARAGRADVFAPIPIEQLVTLKVHFDTVPASVRARLEPHLRTFLGTAEPLAKRVAALQELARAGRDAVLVLDAGALAEEVRAQEAAMIGDLRQVVAAERTYAAANAGLFDSPACLMEPRRCNPKSGLQPLLPQPFDGEGRGYRRTFHPGTGISREESKKLKAAPTSLRNFALTAVPLDAARGLRGLCADDTRACAVDDVALLAELEDGRCPAACRDLP